MAAAPYMVVPRLSCIALAGNDLVDLLARYL